MQRPKKKKPHTERNRKGGPAPRFVVPENQVSEGEPGDRDRPDARRPGGTSERSIPESDVERQRD